MPRRGWGEDRRDGHAAALAKGSPSNLGTTAMGQPRVYGHSGKAQVQERGERKIQSTQGAPGATDVRSSGVGGPENDVVPLLLHIVVDLVSGAACGIAALLVAFVGMLGKWRLAPVGRASLPCCLWIRRWFGGYRACPFC